MTDNNADGRGSRLGATRFADIHRVNGIFYGQPGRISYVPSDDPEKDTGDLNVTRITEEAPFFRQLSSFEEWLPPSKTKLPESDLTTSQSIRSQRLWLLKSHPEAFLGNSQLGRVLSEEMTHRSPQLYPAPVSPGQGALLDVGEILDVSDTHSIGGCPAVAMAAGESGHILRLIELRDELLSWDERKELGLRLRTTKSAKQGFWLDGGAPITQIRFAFRHKRYDQIRWLIVQKATSTTVLAPELRSEPISDLTPSQFLEAGRLSQILANPIATITSDDTGGSVHCDFAFNPSGDPELPQLAIIDRSGHWTLWDLKRGRYGNSKRAMRVRMGCSGYLGPGPTVGPTPSDAVIPGPHRVFWIYAKDASQWTGPNDASQHINDLYPRLDPSSMKSRAILLCSLTDMVVVDTNTHDVICALSLAKRGNTERILDVQQSPHEPSHVFVLTSSTFFWLDFLAPRSSQTGQPAILLSCPLVRSNANETLRLSVTGGPSLAGLEVSSVIIFSSQSQLITLLWCSFDAAMRQPHLHQQVLHLSPALNLATEPSHDPSQFLCMLALPAKLSMGDATIFPDDFPDKIKLVSQFYQFVGIGSDMSLYSFLGATASRRDALDTLTDTHVHRPVSRNRRKSYLQRTERSFVLPDELSPGMVESRRSKIPRQGDFVPESGRRSRVVDLGYFFQKLREGVDFALTKKGAARESEEQTRLAAHFYAIRTAIEENLGQPHLPLRLLLDLTGDDKEPFDLYDPNSDWNDQTRQLMKIDPHRIRILQQDLYSSGLNIIDLFERFSILWSAQLPDDELPEGLHRRLQLVLQLLATEVYLAGKGIMIMPSLDQLTPDPALPEMTWPEEEPKARLDESQGVMSSLPTPSATPSLEPGDSPSEHNDEEPEEDAAITRLRRYMSIQAFAPPKKRTSRLLSRWPEERGTDPTDTVYVPPNVEQERLKRERSESMRRRKSPRKPQVMHDEVGGPSFSQPTRPRIMHSSQAVEDATQSQTSPFPSQTLSQIVPGRFGTRPVQGSKKKKKKKSTVGGFR